ncbi:hypothetical protein A2641_01600 [Candidatus Nomurabacteria bacterium RIFCSPHIGHO2_01_FULL_37_25]|uniref:DUF3137 domain-containing protein n=1 Tax=Candidatus Nomurabacteria bacterium RIFCSPLOWO2_01_FULL_36_16 TaxID=1801767 RepID=A0A1F6WZ45_9BACT|nr:MAG: hypothetical protein A2641_01600 [Candidatus Nomurabacteria bacterium RIFCSPHIGHO2_01_FULL_37_25]OGI75401.1 MAG: hypothetical protein A3D36_02500 [Candidatus Nomurabacteria bacterium RIFCSPHIGHO2_02_FULL_36_29]OGI87148.1 MAG: hypothetical protein A3A91_00595 [Candidatus Nomurabacteria bacterium RIFCSPLOWO2_01_FULL_36_16]OGI97294.1 MAG: hypothetical protein A3I84_00765 [Candidatus Nomurabacteria bacterium RIFCSPLOWO2_02_FULL_36_8]
MEPYSDEYSEVLDIKKVFFQILKKKIKNIILGTFLLLIWSVLCIIFLVPKITSSDFGFFLILFPWLLFLGWLSILYSKVREAFWKQLALKYGWEYTSTKNISQEKALLFNIGHSKFAPYGIIGSYNNHPFHIFEYEYTIGSGKHKTTYSFTVFEVKFTGTFPHLYLNYKSDGYSNMPSVFSSLAKISVPYEFEDKFKLYAPKEYETETLEIFTPDIFALLIDSKWNHDMEFVDGELIIYRNEKFNNFTDLDGEFNKIKKFISILSPRLNRLKLTQIGDIAPLLR